jgi:putative flippase GtrA
MSARAEELPQILRYVIVGVLTNALLFSSYLLLSASRMGAKTAMSLLYVPGVIVGFLGNRNFTFRHEARTSASIVRNFARYAFGYLFTFASLVIFVDTLLLPADYVALALIVVTAGILFALQRCWVFPREEPAAAGNREASDP